MSNYLLFTTAAEYSDENGVTCTLEDHLAYLYKWGGSADNFDSADTIKEAIELADAEGFDVAVVDTIDYEIVYG